MKLQSPFYKLPLRFDIARLREEVDQFKDADWRSHPTGYQGNSAVVLISANGQQNDDMSGPMLPTDLLAKCPYIQQVLAEFNTTFSRSRLMRLHAGSEVPRHSDINYHWFRRVRLHIPIITDPDIRFYCGDHVVHMPAGEAWIFDTWKQHRVVNPTKINRIHLVADTAGSPEFWSLVEQSERPAESLPAKISPRFIPYDPHKSVSIKTERYNVPIVMSPGEMDLLIEDVLNDIDFDSSSAEIVEELSSAANNFRYEWRELWSLHGTHQSGWPMYDAVRTKTIERLQRIDRQPLLRSNQANSVRVIMDRVVHASFNPHLAQFYAGGVAAPSGSIQPRQATVSQIRGAPISARQSKIGRNDPCPCGSGKKYKHCHG